MFSLFKKITSKKLALSLMAGVLAVGLLAGCGTDQKSGSDQPKEKILRVGSETTFPPFEFTEGDKYVGFDIDLADAVAKKMGYKMEFKSMGFDALIPALQSNDIDMIASGINPTPERAKAILFSDPYFDKGGFVTVVKKDNTTIKDMSSLAGKRIGAQIGTVGADLAHKVPNANVKEVDSNSQLFTELKAGTIDAVIIDNPVALYYMKQGADKDLKIAGAPVDAEPFVFGFRMDDKDLQAQVNKALADLKADGTYQKIYDKWFGASK